MCFPILLFIAFQLSVGREDPLQVVDSHFAKALRAQQSNEFEIAESRYRLILGICLKQLGDIYFQLEEYDRAGQAYRQVLQSVPFFEQLLIDLGYAHLYGGRYQEGIQVVESLMELAPLSANYSSGGSGNILKLRDSVTMTALQVPARHLLAKLYFLNGQYDKAIVELEGALQLDPKDLGVAYTLALAYLKQQPGKAKQVFERMLGSLGDSSQLRVSMGRAYQEAGIWEQALEQFRRAVQLNPRQPSGHYYLGLTHLLQQQIPEGIKALREELALNPDHYFAHLYLGFTYALKDNTAEAIQNLSRTIDLNPNYPLPYLFVGQLEYQLRNIERAIPPLRKAASLMSERLKQEKPQPLALRFAGAAHYLLGRSLLETASSATEAEHHLRTAEELMKASGGKLSRIQGVFLPEDTLFNLDTLRRMLWTTGTPLILDRNIPDFKIRDGLIEKTKSYLAMAARAQQALNTVVAEREKASHDSEQASEQSLRQFLRTHPESASTLFHLAKMARKQGGSSNSSNGLQYLKQARDLAPYCPKILLEFAYASLVAAAPPDTAISVLKRLRLMEPDNSETLFTLGQALIVRQNSDEIAEALKHFRRYVELKPEVAEGHGFLGYSAFMIKDYDLAERHLVRSLELNRNQTAPYFYQGMIAFERGEDQKSRDLLSLVLKMQPNHGMARLGLGKLFYRSQEYQNAVAELQRAATLLPEMPEVHYQLSLTYRQLGDAEKSREALQTYERLKGSRAK